MKFVIPLHKATQNNLALIGGKGAALAVMHQDGVNLPLTLCITTGAYLEYVSSTGLNERIQLELNRKQFKDMRWEEIWDAALRIRNMFLNRPMPKPLYETLQKAVAVHFENRAAVVRSSAPGEDSAGASFAGLHESYVNVKGIERILEYVRRVWASLWSDAALLYRQELGLDAHKCSMAVLVQEIVRGDRSGVVFSRSPVNPEHSVIEAVHGLNQGLVDGLVEPDRWDLDRNSGELILHTPARRHRAMVPALNGVKLQALAAAKKKAPPLGHADYQKIFMIARRLESLFHAPQDIEWTFRGNRLFLLQSRPITTENKNDSEDRRSWYLSLRRSFENLKELREKIQTELIPEMIRTADRLAGRDLTKLSDTELAGEIKRRDGINTHWVQVYWKEFIPFAHGVRLFGQFYNDTLKPQNPYEFVDLLKDSKMVSLARNRMLLEMAGMVRQSKRLADRLARREYGRLGPKFKKCLDEFVQKFGDLTCMVAGGTACDAEADALFRLVLEMSKHPPKLSSNSKATSGKEKAQAFLRRFKGDKRKQASAYLDLARTSYQLRDDDNIYLGRIEAQLIGAVHEGKRRLALKRKVAKRLTAVIQNVAVETDKKQAGPADNLLGEKIKARQLVGHPAGPGIATGKARVIFNHGDLAGFKFGEILVCDAVDPNMTFVVPLATAIVERRGGMLIHGAIIAREYGLACVTGIPAAIAKIKTGDQVTVDGYLGIVTIA